jgi:endoglucanase
MDRGIITHPGVVRWLRETAESAHIPVQYTARNTGSTDASAIYTTRAGIPSGPISVPCRYIHGPAAILNLNDLANAVQLVGAALHRFDSGYLAREA